MLISTQTIAFALWAVSGNFSGNGHRVIGQYPALYPFFSSLFHKPPIIRGCAIRHQNYVRIFYVFLLETNFFFRYCIVPLLARNYKALQVLWLNVWQGIYNIGLSFIFCSAGCPILCSHFGDFRNTTGSIICPSIPSPKIITGTRYLSARSNASKVIHNPPALKKAQGQSFYNPHAPPFTA